MRLDEAEKILNKNGYELINEDLASFLGSGNPLAGITCFFLVVLYMGGLSGAIYGLGIGIKKFFSIIVKRLTRRTKEERIVLEAFVEALEGLKKKENKEKFAKIIFDKLDLIGYCNNKYIRTMDQFLLVDEIYIDNKVRERYKKDYNDDDIDIQCNIRDEMITLFLEKMLPKGLKLDNKSRKILTNVIVELGFCYAGYPDDNEFFFILSIGTIVDNIKHYDYKE